MKFSWPWSLLPASQAPLSFPLLLPPPLLLHTSLSHLLPLLRATAPPASRSGSSLVTTSLSMAGYSHSVLLFRCSPDSRGWPPPRSIGFLTIKSKATRPSSPSLTRCSSRMCFAKASLLSFLCMFPVLSAVYTAVPRAGNWSAWNAGVAGRRPGPVRVIPCFREVCFPATWPSESHCCKQQGKL